MPDSRIQMLLALIDQAYDQATWHGPNLRSELRGVSANQALWRPQPKRHTIWELTLHCAYWKYMATRTLRGDTARGGFPRKPANFPAIPTRSTTKDWKEDLDFLQRCHHELRQAVANLEPARLDARLGRWTLAEHAFGAAYHDIYHAGQIRLLRRMQENMYIAEER